MGSQQTIILVLALKCLALSYTIQFTLQSHVVEWGFRFGLGMNSNTYINHFTQARDCTCAASNNLQSVFYLWLWLQLKILHRELNTFGVNKVRRASTGMSSLSKVTWPQLAWQPPENQKKNSREVHPYFIQKCHNNSWDARHFFCKLENHSHSCKQGEILQLPIAMCYR